MPSWIPQTQDGKTWLLILSLVERQPLATVISEGESSMGVDKHKGEDTNCLKVVG